MLHENVCWCFEEEGRNEAVLGVREDKEEVAGGARSLIERRYAESGVL